MEYKLYKRFHEVVPVRYVVCALSSIFGFTVFSLRGVMPISLLEMTPRIHHSNHTVSDCPFTEEIENTVNSNVISYRYDHGFDWNEKQQGFILSSYFIGITITQFLGGIISNHFTSKWLIGLGTFVAAVLTFAIPSVARFGYWPFLIVWFLVGFSSGLTISPMYSFIGRWSLISERGLMFSMLLVGFTLGSVVSQTASGYIIKSMDYNDDGWKYPFYIFGCLSFAWFIFWLLLMSNSPQDHVAISENELKMLTLELGEQTNLSNKENIKVPWLAILTSIPFWTSVSVDFSAHWNMDLFQTQIPNFYAKVLHQNIFQTGLFSSLPFIVYAVCSFLSGTISVWLHSKLNLSTNCSRKLFTSIAVFGGGALGLGVAYECNVVLNTVLLTASMGMLGFYTSGNFCTATDMSPRFSGVIFGISNTISNFGGFICPALTGYIVSRKDDLKSWRYVFLISSCLCFGSGIFYLFLGSSTLQPWANGDEKLKPEAKRETSEIQDNVSIVTENKT